MDQWDEDASQVTVATKNSSEGKYSAPTDIPHKFREANQVNIPKTPKQTHKKKRKHKKKYDKQATGSNEANDSSQRTHEGHQPGAGSTLGANANSGNNSNNRPREEMNDKSSKFNDEQCPGILGGNDDTIDVDELQSFSINFRLRDASQDKVAKVLKRFLLECMNKDKGIIFYPSNNQTAPPPTPFSTKATAVKTTHQVKEFCNMIMARME